MIEELETDYERADCLQSILMAKATGELASDADFVDLRSYFINSPYSHLIPSWLRSKRSLGHFWPFIQSKFGTYRERRTFIHDELAPLLDATEKKSPNPIEKTMDSILESPSYESVSVYWHKCLDELKLTLKGQ